MSGKDKKKDSEPGVGAAVATGAAVLLGAAALYGAKKLFDFWSASTSDSAGATASGGQPIPAARPKCIDSDSDDDNNFSSIPSTSRRNTTYSGDHISSTSNSSARGSTDGHHGFRSSNDYGNASNLGARPKNNARQASNIGSINSLAEELQLYSRMYDVDRRSATRAISIVAQIKQALNVELKSNLPDDLKKVLMKEEMLKEFGSFVEGSLIVDADRFDMMLPLKLSSDSSVVSDDNESVKYSIKLLDDENESYCNACGCVDGSKIVSCLETGVGNVLRSMVDADFCCEVKCDGSCLLFNVTYVSDSGIDKKLQIYLYPVVLTDGNCFIPYASFDGSGQMENGSLWKPFHIEEEQLKLNLFNGELSTHIKLLKIFKAIRLNFPHQFGKLPVYHYKVILYRILDDQADKSEWCDSALAERFVDFLVELGSCCKERVLQDYFEPRVNLFEHISGEILSSIMLQINKFVGQNDFSTLLERHNN